MPITFGCACGKPFTVADAYAGKRTKCPACGTALTVPAAPEPASPEDEAFRLLAEGNEKEADDEPPPSLARRDPDPAALAPPPPARPGPPPAAPAPPARPKRLHKTRPADDSRYERPRIYISPGVMGGIGSMAFGAIWFFVGMANNRIYFYAPVLFFLGLITVVRGFFGHEPD